MTDTALKARPAVVRSVLCVAVAATLCKLLLAANSYGTDDVTSWIEFAGAVEQFGPIEIYGRTALAQYNHGPLAGWLLVLVNLGQGLGFDLPFLLRIPASLADLVSCWLVFRLLSECTTPVVAAWAAGGLVWSPVLVVISGFHGNTDPVFVALVLASFWLLTRRDRPVWAGVCLGLAVSLKLVPVVAIPWLLFMAFQRGRPVLTRFVFGGAVVFLVLWMPVVLLRWTEFSENVLTYRGIWLREWGIAELVERAGYPQAELWLAEHGAYAIVIAALVPFLAARLAHHDVVGLGLSLVSMLLLAPAFGMQYLAWALAPAYLVSVRAAWVYNLSASALVLSVYSLWSGGGPPWQWDVAAAVPFSVGQLMLMAIAWFSLLLVWLEGVIATARGTLYNSRVDDESPGRRVLAESTSRPSSPLPSEERGTTR